MPARFAAHKSPVNRGKCRRPSYWQRMQTALAEVPDDGEQEVWQYVHGRHRWEELQQRIDEIASKSKLMAGKFGRSLPERAVKIRDAWQTTLKTTLEDRLAAEKSLAEAFHLEVEDEDTELHGSLDEILTELMQFQTLEEQRAYLISASLWDAEKLLEQLANFLGAAQERYNTLLSEERKELEKSGACSLQYSEDELHQLLLEIRGCSPQFAKGMEDNPELARFASENPEEIESRTFLLNPLPGPRAMEVVEELQLRHAAIKLQSVLQCCAGNEEGSKVFIQRALDILTPRFDNVEQVLWGIFRSEFSFQPELHAGGEQPVETLPNHDVRLELAFQDTDVEEQKSAAVDSEVKTNRTELVVIVDDFPEAEFESDDILVTNVTEFAVKPSVGTWLSLMWHGAAFKADAESVNIEQDVPANANEEGIIEEVPSTIEEQDFETQAAATTSPNTAEAPCSELILPKLGSVQTSSQIERRRCRVRRQWRNAFRLINRRR